MTPVVLDITSQVFSSDTTGHSTTAPATVAAGDLLLWCWTNDGSATCTTPVGTDGFTELWSSNASSTVQAYVWAKIAVGDEDGSSLTATTSASEQAASKILRVQAGSWSGDLGDIVVGTPVSGILTNADPPALAGMASGDYLVVCTGHWSAPEGTSVVTGYPSSYTGGEINSSDSSTAGAQVAVCYRALESITGEDPGAFTSVNRAAIVNTIAILGASPTPVLQSLTPANEAVGVSIDTDLSIEFDIPVSVGTGDINLYQLLAPSTPTVELRATDVTGTEGEFGDTPTFEVNWTIPGGSYEEGDIIGIALSKDGDGAFTSFPPADWSESYDAAGGTACRGAFIWRRFANGQTIDTVTVTGDAESYAARIWLIRGAHRTNDPATNTPATSATHNTAANPPGVSIPWAPQPSLVLAIVAGDGNGSASSYPAGYTNTGTHHSGSDVTSFRSWLAYAELSDVTTLTVNPGSFVNTSEQWVAGTVVFGPHQASELVEAIDVTDTGQVTFDDDTVTAEPSEPLDYETEYYVLVDDGAITGWAGISDPTTWAFTTGSSINEIEEDAVDVGESSTSTEGQRAFQFLVSDHGTSSSASEGQGAKQRSAELGAEAATDAAGQVGFQTTAREVGESTSATEPGLALQRGSEQTGESNTTSTAAKADQKSAADQGESTTTSAGQAASQSTAEGSGETATAAVPAVALQRASDTASSSSTASQVQEAKQAAAVASASAAQASDGQQALQRSAATSGSSASVGEATAEAFLAIERDASDVGESSSVADGQVTIPREVDAGGEAGTASEVHQGLQRSAASSVESSSEALPQVALQTAVEAAGASAALAQAATLQGRSAAAGGEESTSSAALLVQPRIATGTGESVGRVAPALFVQRAANDEQGSSDTSSAPLTFKLRSAAEASDSSDHAVAIVGLPASGTSDANSSSTTSRRAVLLMLGAAIASSCVTTSEGYVRRRIGGVTCSPELAMPVTVNPELTIAVTCTPRTN